MESKVVFPYRINFCMSAKMKLAIDAQEVRQSDFIRIAIEKYLNFLSVK